MPKIKVEVAIDDDLLDSVIEAISRRQDGKDRRDGKIFVYELYDVLQAIRIRTGESGTGSTLIRLGFPMENNFFELQYAIDTFYFSVGALVMWMAAGFAMLESGLWCGRRTTEILTKNIALPCGRVHHVPGLRLRDHVRRRLPAGRHRAGRRRKCRCADRERAEGSLRRRVWR